MQFGNRDGRSGTRWKGLRLSLLLLLCLFLCASCGLLPEEISRRTVPTLKKARELTYSFAAVTRGDMQLTQNVSVKNVPLQKVFLNFGTDGVEVNEMLVSVGDYVHTGDLLGTLNTEGAEEAVESCRRRIAGINLQISQLEENRALALKKQQYLYRTDPEALAEGIRTVNESYDASLDSLRDTLNVQQMRLESLLENLEKCRLVSPIDGVVAYVRPYTDHALSDSRQTAVTVTDNSFTFFTVTTPYWQYFPEGKEVIITVKKVDYMATVRAPESLGREKPVREEGVKSEVCLVLQDPAISFSEETRGTVTLLLEERENVLCIPEDAVCQAGEDTIVYYLNEAGVQAYKTVKTGLVANGFVEVLEGLQEGEAVILP